MGVVRCTFVFIRYFVFTLLTSEINVFSMTMHFLFYFYYMFGLLPVVNNNNCYVRQYCNGTLILFCYECYV